jgi:hypothetical protein
MLFPTTAIPDPIDIRLGNSVDPADLWRTQQVGQTPNIRYVFRRELGSSIPLALVMTRSKTRTVPFTSRLAMLRHFVGDVILRRAKKEVRRITAGGIITAVQDPETGRNGASGNHPRDSVRSNVMAIPAHPSVAVAVCHRLPLPAIINIPDGHLLPKALNVSLRRSQLSVPSASAPWRLWWQPQPAPDRRLMRAVAVSSCCPSFAAAVHGIFRYRAQEHVRRVYTGRHVSTWTVVTNKKSRLNLPAHHLPCYAMGHALTHTVKEASMPVDRFPGSPEPAAVRAMNINARPEAGDMRLRQCSHQLPPLTSSPSSRAFPSWGTA